MNKQQFRIDKNEKLIALLEKRDSTVTNNYTTTEDNGTDAPQNIMGKPVVIDTNPREGQVLTYDEEEEEWTASNKNILTVITVTDTYTVLLSDHIIICNKATAMTVNLPAATGSGRQYSISNVGAGMVTIDGDSSDTIDGLTTQT